MVTGKLESRCPDLIQAITSECRGGGLARFVKGTPGHLKGSHRERPVQGGGAPSGPPQSGQELWKAEARVTRCLVGWEEAENKVPAPYSFPLLHRKALGLPSFSSLSSFFFSFFLFPNSSFLLSSSPVNPLLSPFLHPPAVLSVPPSPAHLCLPLHCLLVISLDLTPLPMGRWAEAEMWLR